MKRVDPYYLTPEWKALKQRVLTANNHNGRKCTHCGVKCLGKKLNMPSPHVDHIIERKDGGSDKFDNLQILCPSCHNKKTKYTANINNKPEIGVDGYPI